ASLRRGGGPGAARAVGAGGRKAPGCRKAVGRLVSGDHGGSSSAAPAPAGHGVAAGDGGRLRWLRSKHARRARRGSAERWHRGGGGRHGGCSHDRWQRRLGDRWQRRLGGRRQRRPGERRERGGHREEPGGRQRRDERGGGEEGGVWLREKEY